VVSFARPGGGVYGHPVQAYQQRNSVTNNIRKENQMDLEMKETLGHIADEVMKMKDKQNTELSELKADLAKLDKYVARIGAPPGGGSSRPGVDSEGTKSVVAYMQSGRPTASLSTLDDPAGGYLVSPDMQRGINQLAETISAMRRISTVQTVKRDIELIVSMGGSTSGWVTEKGSRDETDFAQLKKILIILCEIYTMPVCTARLLQTSEEDVAQWFILEAARSFAKLEEEAFISGSGVSEPRGILSYDFVANASYAWGKIGYIAGGHASQLNDVDKLIELQHALPASYRDGAVWLMSDSTWNTLRTLKDGEGNYIWRPGVEDRAPSTLLGKPVQISEFMPSIEENSIPILFGDFKQAYRIIDHQRGVALLRDDLTEKGFVKFYTTKLTGGSCVNFEAVRAMKVAAS
jgi:HK97 family phage major capsid protein